MPATTGVETIQTFEFIKEELIEAPIEISFQATLDETGPENKMPDGKPFPFKLEAWPGGRWFRDLGHGAGHFWGTVQVIKPPTLLEICGPMFMSYPATNFLQYRLTADGKNTLLKLTHKAMGLIPKQHLEGMQMGWDDWTKRIRERATHLRSSSR